VLSNTTFNVPFSFALLNKIKLKIVMQPTLNLNQNNLGSCQLHHHSHSPTCWWHPFDAHVVKIMFYYTFLDLIWQLDIVAHPMTWVATKVANSFHAWCILTFFFEFVEFWLGEQVSCFTFTTRNHGFFNQDF
jgi:hypothetical protein